MGIIGKIQYQIKEKLGSLGEAYGVYRPEEHVPTRPSPPPGYEYTGTTTGGTVLTKTGGKVMGSPQQKAAAEKARLATIEMRRLQEIKRQEQVAASQRAAQTQQQVQAQIQSQTVAGQLGGYKPQYQNGRLLGFVSPTGEFLPKEITIGKGGLYQPWQVTTPGKEVAPGGAPGGFIQEYTSPLGIVGVRKEAGKKGEKAYKFEVPTDKGLGIYQWEQKPAKREFPLATKMELASALEEGREVYYTPEGARVEEKPTGILGGLLSGYGKVEKYVSEKIPSMFELKEKGYKLQAKISRKTVKEVKEMELKSLRMGAISFEQYKKVPSWQKKLLTKTKVGYLPSYEITGAEIGKALYEEWQQKPVKATATFATFAALPFAFKGVGLGAKAIGLGKITTKFPGVTKVVGMGVKVGLPTFYAGTVGARIYQAPKGERAYTAGRITAGEIIPMYAGFKLGAYGLRRYELVKELRLAKERLMPQERTLFETQLREAKAYRKIQPKVKEISFKDIEYIPKKAEPTLTKFIQRHKGKLIVGGSVAEQTQLYVKPLAKPHDIDIYVRGLAERWTATRLTKEASKELIGAGVKRVSIPPKHPTQITIAGKKAIEFHPYTEYLKSNIEQVLPLYKTAQSGLVKTPSGINVLSQPVQWQRMLVRGYTEKPEAIARAFKIRTSIMETARIKTVGKEFYYVSEIPGAPPGKTFLGATYFTKGEFFRKPERIEVLERLGAKFKSKVVSHELIHAMHPTWTEAAVRGREPAISIPRLIEATKGLKTMRYSVMRGEGIISKVSTYPRYKPYPIIPYPTIYPTRLISPSYYLPKPPIKKQIIYKPKQERFLTYKTPYKPSQKIYPSLYKPSPHIFYPSYYKYYRGGKPTRPAPPPIAWFREAKRLKYPRVKRLPVQPQKYTPSLTAGIFRIKGKKPSPILGKFKFGYVPGIRPLPF